MLLFRVEVLSPVKCREYFRPSLLLSAFKPRQLSWNKSVVETKWMLQDLLEEGGGLQGFPPAQRRCQADC